MHTGVHQILPGSHRGAITPPSAGAHKGVRDFGVGQSRLSAIATERGMRGAQRKCDILTSLALDASGVFPSCARLVRQVRFARPFLWACADRAFCLSFALRPAQPGRCIIGEHEQAVALFVRPLGEICVLPDDPAFGLRCAAAGGEGGSDRIIDREQQNTAKEADESLHIKQ